MKHLFITTYVDEIPLHAGGLIVNAARAGHEVHVLVLCYPGYAPRAIYAEATEESPYGPFGNKATFVQQFAQPEMEAIVKILGITDCVTWEYDGDTDSLFGQDVVLRMVDHLNKLQPDLVVTHWPIGDYSDFIGARSSLLRCLIQHKLEKIPQVFFSETLTGRHTLCFHPDTYVDITDSISIKKEACAAVWHGLNLDYFFYPFAVPVAQFRGRESGVHFAEAYSTLHGPFGVLKRARKGMLPEARPETISRAGLLLPERPRHPGIHPKTYGKIDPQDAEKVFGI